MQKILKQIAALYGAMESKKKIFFLTSLIVCILFLLWVITASSYRPLQTLSLEECKKIEGFCETEGIAYRKRGEHEILIPEKERARVEKQLDQIFHEERFQGLELFDTNTWMKGEKELQILEMRALKGQLERDLSSFENIAHATVILDLVPPKLFGQGQYKTKASVILTLQDEELSHSELQAIAYHLSGAVRGLEPNRIAISDTSGKLYKAIEPEGEGSFLSSHFSELEQIKEKINKLLLWTLGKGNFHMDLTLDEKRVFVVLMIKRENWENNQQIALENQMKALLVGLHREVQIVIDFLPPKEEKIATHSKAYYPFWPYTALAFGILSMTLFFFIRKKSERGNKRGGIDMGKLADRIKDQDPKTIALLFSYLEADKAEQLLGALPYPVQKRVALHLPGLQSREEFG